MTGQTKFPFIRIGLVVTGLCCLLPAPQARADGAAATGFDATALQTKAANGDTDASFQLGTLDYVGLGVVQDWVAAAKWLTQAANAGDANAQCELGLLYQTGSYGDGLPQEPQVAAQWYQKSADQGNAYGEFALAALYQNGQGVAKDPTKAQALFAKAAAQGYVVDTTSFPLEQLNRHFHELATSLTGETTD